MSHYSKYYESQLQAIDLKAKICSQFRNLTTGTVTQISGEVPTPDSYLSANGISTIPKNFIQNENMNAIYQEILRLTKKVEEIGIAIQKLIDNKADK